MQKIKLTERRKRILAFWYSYNKRHHCWPTFSEAAKHLNVSKYCIHYNVALLIDKEWMEKIGEHDLAKIGLSKYGLKRLIHFERVSLGMEQPEKKEEKDPSIFKMILTKRQRDNAKKNR